MAMFDKIAVPDGTKLQLGRGAIFFDRFSTAGVKRGAFFMGNGPAFEINPSVETRAKRGVVDNTNPLLANVEVSRTFEVNITLSEYLKRNVAIALLGDVAAGYEQAATTVTDETITPAGGSLKGATYYTSKRKTNVPVIKVSPATVKTLGTDYEYDSETGAVLVKESGSIADASILLATYTPTAITTPGVTKITPGTAGNIVGELRFVGKPMNGEVQEIVLWKCQISPAGALAFISEDFVDYPLKATLLSDAVAHPLSPFGEILQYAAS